MAAKARTRKTRFVDWEATNRRVKQQFPRSCGPLNDDRAGLAGDDADHIRSTLTVNVMGAIFRDVCNDWYADGRRGHRKPLAPAEYRSLLRSMLGTDYTTLPFHEAFTDLARGFTLDSLAARVGISRSQVNRLMKGEIAPDDYDMTMVAKAFYKTPTFFAEYRYNLAARRLREEFESNPELSMAIARKLEIAC